jgi:hypothetical protein
MVFRPGSSSVDWESLVLETPLIFGRISFWKFDAGYNPLEKFGASSSLS